MTALSEVIELRDMLIREINAGYYDALSWVIESPDVWMKE